MVDSPQAQTVSVAGHRLRLTHPDKVLYPATGTTKADVLAYYMQIAPLLLPHVQGRIVTRKRWVEGVGTADQPGEVFFEKNLPASAPSWIRRVKIRHKTHTNTYPVFADAAALAWAGQVGALELHVPQWRVNRQGTPQNPDRLVLDLDPGPGAGLPECVAVAQRARTLLRELGLVACPVTSGSKGIHLYAGLDGSYDAAYINRFAKQLALALESELPDLVVSSMRKDLRAGKVLVDWSQNNASKTTIAPYSLRGTLEPHVATPRTWRELNGDVEQLTLDQVMARMKRRKDPMAELISAAPAEDRLASYRSMRDASKTPEPVPDQAGVSAGGMSFVIQEHHARRLHWDFRLERDGVLVSWALPKGVPDDPGRNHLAVQTEDHPLEYGTFEGTIPQGEYGGGEVTIWDAGTYELHKWREGQEVIATLTGRPDGGLGGTRKYALIRTGENWLIHLMKPDAVAQSHRQSMRSGFVEPMLATLGDTETISREADWSYEMKWDGIRAIAVVDGSEVGLFTRNGHDITTTYREVAAALADVGLSGTVLDGEIVALDESGTPSFGRLQQATGAATYVVFDVLRSEGTSMLTTSYDGRRAALFELAIDSGVVRAPEAFDGTLAAAVQSSLELGLEGVVAKRRDGRYRPGRRSPSWIKIKHQRMQEVVIGGWRPGKGVRADTIGSLLVGIPEGSGLRYVGRVGTGFDHTTLERLRASLDSMSRKTGPFNAVPAEVAREACWVTPRLVAEVTFVEWTTSGVLRQPSWRGLRADKSPGAVKQE